MQSQVDLDEGEDEGPMWNWLGTALDLRIRIEVGSIEM